MIEPMEQDEILRTFRIKEGRNGDFVTDINGKQISLTALIFGRHHPIFDQIKFIQIAQLHPGEAVIILTQSKHSELTKNKARMLMDLRNVGIRFDIQIVEQPYRTKAGKVTLKVPYNQL